MRRRHDSIEIKQNIIGRRFLHKHIKRRTGHMASLQRRRQCQLIDKTAPRTIDDPHALFCFVKRVRTDDIAGCCGHRRMNADKIGPPQ